ncbi:MAG: AsmA family protein, partial [Betaproteobacteria bacterium]
PWGKASGKVTMQPQQPFVLAGTFEMSKAQGPAYNAKLNIGGTLSRIELRASAEAQPAQADAAVILTPFAASAFASFEANATDVDPHAWSAGAPAARLELHAKAQGRADRDHVAGELTLTNQTPGTLDRKLLPLVSFKTAFAGPLGTLVFSDVALDLGKAGRAAGNGMLTGGNAIVDVATGNLNLQGLHAQLKPTQLKGNLRVVNAAGEQSARLKLAQGRYRFGFDGTLKDSLVRIKEVSAAVGSGTFMANGSLGLGETKPVQMQGSLTHFDPSQFGKYPQADINSRFKAIATLMPVLQVTADLSLLKSQLFGRAAVGVIKWHSKGAATPDIAINLSSKIGDTQIDAKGTLFDPVHLQQMDLELALAGRNLAELYPIIGVPLPPTPAYKLSGHLVEHDQIWEFRKFNGKVGASDLAGDFTLDRRKRQFMRADLVSNKLDLVDLSGFIGAGSSAKTSDRNQDKGTHSRRALPDDPFDPEKLRASDADILFTGRSIQTQKLPLTQMKAHLKLSDGVLTLDPLDFGAVSGSIVAKITLDARHDVILGNSDVRAKGVKLNELFPSLKPSKASLGDLEGRVRLITHGNSIAAMLGSSDGKVAVMMDGGAVSDLVLRAINLDIAHIGETLLRGDREIPLRCLIADFNAEGGHLRPTVFVIDTEHTIIGGEGEIDLHDEKLDLKLTAHPKDASIISLRGPIKIGGTLGTPVVRPELGKPLVRGAAALALGILATPLAALIPLIQMGKNKSVDCAPLVARTRTFIDNSASAPGPTSAPQTTESAIK